MTAPAYCMTSFPSGAKPRDERHNIIRVSIMHVDNRHFRAPQSSGTGATQHQAEPPQFKASKVPGTGATYHQAGVSTPVFVHHANTTFEPPAGGGIFSPPGASDAFNVSRYIVILCHPLPGVRTSARRIAFIRGLTPPPDVMPPPSGAFDAHVPRIINRI